MTTNDFTTQERTDGLQRTEMAVEIEDLTNWASDAVVPMINLLDATRLSPGAQVAWDISNDVFATYASRDAADDAVAQQWAEETMQRLRDGGQERTV